MTPTPEQLLCVEAARVSTDNLLIEALAGAAKTTTLELIARAIPREPILCVAFNKRIQEDMAKRLPGHVQCKTLNAIGHSVWGSNLGRARMIVDTKKMSTILKSIPLAKGEKDEISDNYSDVLALLRSAKVHGYYPDDSISLCSAVDLFNSLELEVSDLYTRVLNKAMVLSVSEANAGRIDFDDQIYMPCLFGGTWPRFPVVMVDEAQDLSPLNHVMLDHLVTKRLIAVGDARQSIYGFRGSVSNGMNALAERFNMQRLMLSTSFRCPRAVIRKARNHAPHMQWPEWAVEGTAERLGRWDESAIPDNSAVICRNNAPLFKLGFALLARGRGINLIGADIGPGLIRILKKLGPETMPKEQTLTEILKWERMENAKKKKASTSDRAACLRVFASEAKTLGEAISYAESLFKAQGPIQLLSGHKAKGLEWSTVFHLDPWRIPSVYAESPEDLEQEENIRYVILTRAKERYVEVNISDFGEQNADAD